MNKFHINPDTGRINACTAKYSCPIGQDFPHFDSRIAAEKHIESFEKEHNSTFSKLIKEFSPSTSHVKGKEEMENMVRQYYSDLDDRRYRILGGPDNIDIHTCYGGKDAVIQLSNDDNIAFLKGCCTIWAFESHRQTGLPLVAFSSEGKHLGSGDWTGHVALKVGDEEYFDASGIVDETSIISDFDKEYKISKEPMNITFEELKNAIKIKTLTNKNSDELGRAALSYKVNNLLKANKILTS